MSSTVAPSSVTTSAISQRTFCSADRCAEITYLVSIGDGDDPLPQGYENAGRKVRWLIADVVTDEGATEDDIRRIVDLAEQLRAESGTLLIHCEAGISRSTATALIIYACWLGPGREDEAMRRVGAQRPYAIPNRRIVAIADNLLALNGRLLQARDNWLTSPDWLAE